MPLVIADDMLEFLGVTSTEAQQLLAASLYEHRRVSLGVAARLAGMNRVAFQRFIGSQHIPMGPTVAELDREMETMERLSLL